MPVMYVDDSGSPSPADHTKYFVLSGVIARDEHVKKLQRMVFEYKQSNFIGDLVDSEIHTHDIYGSKNDFGSISLDTKTDLLDKLYEMVAKTECAGILIIIDKNRLQSEKPAKSPLDMAWSFLLERYDMFLRENRMASGHIKADTSPNKTRGAILRTYSKLTNHGMGYQRLTRITQPVFADSAGVYGIQMADAFAYCALKHRTTNDQFVRYWETVRAKLLKSGSGVIRGYGYKEYP